MSLPIYRYRLVPPGQQLQGIRHNTIVAQTVVMIQGTYHSNWFTVPELYREYRTKHRIWGLPPAMRDTLQRRIAYLFEKGILTREYAGNPMDNLPEQENPTQPTEPTQPTQDRELTGDELLELLRKESI